MSNERSDGQVQRDWRDERGSALVAVLVMMLVLTLFALTMAALVTKTSSAVAVGRSASQARAAADAGIAAALAAFDKTEGCTPESSVLESGTPDYTVTCNPITTSATLKTPVTFKSIGSAAGLDITVQAVYDFTRAQSFEAKVGGLTYFSSITTMVQPNIVTSTTTGPARVTGAVGDFHCASVMDANVVVEKDFYADNGCQVAGWVRVRGNATVSPNSKVVGSLTAGKDVNLNSSSSVGGSVVSGGNANIGNGSSVGADLTAVGTAVVGSVDPGSGKLSIGGKLTSGGYARLGDNSSVGGDLATGGYAELTSGTSVGGNVTSTGNSNVGVQATVKGNLTSGGVVSTGDRSSILGTVTAAGDGGTVIRGGVGVDVVAAGAVTVNGTVSRDVTAAGTGATSINGKIVGNLKAAGAVTVGGTVSGDVTAAGTEKTEVKGTVGGNLKAAGAVNIDWNRIVSGDVTAAGTAESSINGTVEGNVRLARAVTVNGNVSGDVIAAGTGLTSVNGSVSGSVKVGGEVTVNYNRPVRGNVITSGTGTDVIYGQISGNLNAGGPVNLDGGSIGGSLTLPNLNQLTFRPTPLRVTGTVTSKPAPAAPSAPSAPSAPVVSLSTPEVKVSAPSSPTIPTWQDYGYASSDWPGYTLRKARCADSNWATDMTASTPTILDATACSGGLTNHPAGTTPVTIGASVVVVSSRIDLQNLTFQAKSGTTPNLWFIVPSAAKAVKKYSVSSGSGEIVLYSTAVLGVPAVLYTPGRIKYTASSFTGSMYAGGADFAWQTPADINAAPVDFPIPLFDSEPSSGPGTFSRTLKSQREVG